jgi:membrane protease YdiL (CAAX protease family)
MALEHAQGTRSARPKAELIPGRARLTMNHVLFLATFLGAWFVLDRLVSSPPNLLSATAALAAASAVLVVGQRAMGVAFRDIPRSLGLGRPVLRALVVAGIVGACVFLCLLLGARIVGVQVELRQDWPSVLLAVLIFHGLAEELVWRGLIDSWQLLERPYPDRFSVVILTASIVVPMSVFLFGDRFFSAPSQVTVRRRLRAST